MNGHPVFARLCDVLMRPMEPLRRPTVSQARGMVLEIGFGTGLNLTHYQAITSLDAVEPDPHMCSRARVHEISAEKLPFNDCHFDTVVCTWTLCTIPDPEQALRELHRVLKPGGVLLYAEHVAASHQPERAIQQAITPVWRRCAAGCNLDRDTIAMIRACGFRDVEDTPRGWRRLNLVPVHTGRAVKAI